MNELITSIAPKLLVASDDMSVAEMFCRGSSLIILGVELADGVPHLRYQEQLFPLTPTAEQPAFLHRILGLAVFSDAARPLMEQAREAVTTAMPGEEFPLFSPAADQGDVAQAFSAWLFNILDKHGAAAARRTTGLQRELALLRSQYETLQDSFQEVERFFQQLFVQPVVAFTNPPNGAALSAPAQVPLGGGVTQELPLPSRGLAGVVLHVAKVSPKASGTLGVHLFARELSRVLESWLIPFAALRPGWVPLLLHRALAGRPELTLQLGVTWQPDTSKASPSLSLGAMHPTAAACATIIGSDVQPRRGLALRLLTSMPGQPVHAMPGAIFPTPVAADQDMVLPRWIFEHVEEVSPPVEGLNWKVVDYIADEMNLLLHPLEDHPTVARLSFTCPAGIRAITMQAKTCHAKGPSIEYALAVLDADQPFEPYFYGNVPAGDSFSGWQVGTPMVPLNVSVNFGAPTWTPRHIYMGTRLAKGQTSDYAWARIQGIVLSPHDLRLATEARS
ncbi:DUF6212 domain-containing protein [Solidesulfovibrio alcoholivorans]|uniref:DUF6212 domain-containing protein n=1 Tax=Solidesulfovibrio alcoholivorans TaxID=81406 RepID=UPI0012EB67F9|nr:DUF6212 domain-containing protein [Solidesulfovibrio alcoholivorans]